MISCFNHHKKKKKKEILLIHIANNYHWSYFLRDLHLDIGQLSSYKKIFYLELCIMNTFSFCSKGSNCTPKSIKLMYFVIASIFYQC